MTASRPDNEVIFHTARDIPDPDRRREYVREACGGDETRIAHVEALLAAADVPDSLLDRPAGSDPVATIDQPSTDRPGTVIGPYKLLEQVGEGGFGVVYMAEQTQPVQRKVALKVLKPGMDTRPVVARFEAERQALALMDHVNIARVFDGGETPPAYAGGSPRPYFVMELVHGVPITRYCDDNHLTPRERLELFVPVCQAIQHAHQKGIIHRDIKPSNVMITLYDGKPVPKVIDFGVAKATEQKLTERTLFTQYGTLVGTFEYMSPEQAELSALGVDTRSDIYSLGVLLYELLTGSTPLTHKRMKEVAYAEIVRMIREEEPPKPSARLSDSGEALASISANRHMEPAKLTKLVRGELDWIVMKALEKDRNRRYETANGFATDVQRYLADEPVLACPPSSWYRFHKFARRNKRALVTASVIGVALLLAVGSLDRVVRDREAGRVRTTTEVNQFLQRAETLYAENKLPEAMAEVQKARGVLEAGRGDEELGRQVRQWLTDLDTAAKLEEIRLVSYDFVDRERVCADCARVFQEYGVDMEEPAEELTARVAASQIKPDLILALLYCAGQLRSARPQDPARWQRLFAIARAADPDPWRLRYDAAHDARDLQTLRELADGADPGRFRTRILASLGSSLSKAGDAEAAVAFLRRIQRQHPGDFLINSNLAIYLMKLEPPQLDEAIAFQRATLAVRPQSALAHFLLGSALGKKGRLDEVVAEYREAIRLRPGFALAHANLGRALHDQKKLDEAIACLRKAIDIDPKDTFAHNILGLALTDRKKLDEAIACFKKAIDIDPTFAAAYSNLGDALRKQKKLDEAIAWCQKALDVDPKSLSAHNNLGLALENQGKVAEAIACFRKAIALDANYVPAHDNLGTALESQNKLAEAIACYRTAIAIDPKNASPHYNLGNTLSAQGKFDEAIAEFRTAIELDPKDPRWHNNLGDALSKKGEVDEAIACFRRAIEVDSKHLRAHKNLGKVLSKQGKVDEAIACFRRVIELDPKHADAHNDLGTAWFKKGKVGEAIAFYRKAVELDPKHAFAHLNLGTALSKKGEVDEAIACFRRGIALDSRHADVHNDLGVQLNIQKKFDEAIACFRRAIELDPKHANAHNNLGNALNAQGKVDEAVTEFRKATELDPKLALAHRNLGWVLFRQGKIDESIHWHRKALALDPKNPRGRHNFGVALTTKGWNLVKNPDPNLRDPKRAIEAVTEAAELDPESSLSWQYVGWVQYRLGNWRASIEALEKSCKLQAGGTGGAGQWIVLALAHAKLAVEEGLPAKERKHHKAEARRRYEQTDQEIDSRVRVRPGDDDDIGQAIWDFREEARKLRGAKETKK